MGAISPGEAPGRTRSEAFDQGAPFVFVFSTMGISFLRDINSVVGSVPARRKIDNNIQLVMFRGPRELSAETAVRPAKCPVADAQNPWRATVEPIAA
jgi:hypothetical protein